MRNFRVLTPWTIRYTRALCLYGFQLMLAFYLLAVVAEQIRPGFFSLTVPLQSLLIITAILGVCALLLPHPVEKIFSHSNNIAQRVGLVIASCIVAGIFQRSFTAPLVFRVLIFIITASTTYLVANALFFGHLEGEKDT